MNDAPFGALAPSPFDRAIMALTGRMPDSWVGLKLAMALRRLVTMRMETAGALDVERWRLRMRLHPRDNGCEKNLLFTPQMYEPPEREELARDIASVGASGRAFVFVDIGANVGLFSLFVAAHAGAGARIFAIEPEPGNQRRLNFNVGANSNLPIKIFPMALSDEAGELVVELDKRDRGGSRTRKVVDAQAEAVRVIAQTLFALLQSERVETVDALKIDVEGFEDLILGPFFRDAPPQMLPHLIIIEDCRGSWKADLMSIIADKGYSVVARSKLNFILRLASR
jgi:FkbM family methyltransferase